MLDQALSHHQRGQLAEAAALYRDILAADPNNADALHLLGVIELQSRRPARAIDLIDHAIALNAGNAAFYSNRANALQELNRLDEAIADYDRALAIAPSFPEALVNRGNALRRAGRADAAIASYDGALAVNSNHAAALAGRGMALDVLQRFEDAVASYDRALALSPGAADIWNNRGAALLELKRAEEAVSDFQRAVAIWPTFAHAHYNAGKALAALRRRDQAIASYQAALAFQPDFVDAYGNLGALLARCGRFTEALECFDRVLDRRPGDANAHSNRANVLRDLGAYDAALAGYDQALANDPNHVGALSNRSTLFRELRRYDEAIVSGRQALALDPTFAEAHNNLGNALVDLGQLEEASASFREAVRARPDYFEARSNLLFAQNYRPNISPAALLAEARSFGVQAAANADRYTTWLNARETGRPLRVGVVSGDLRAHPVAFFLEDVVRELNRDRVEAFAYATHPRSDTVTERLRAYFAAWCEAAHLSDADLARQIRDDKIDVLIDLSGHTAHNRLPMFAWKPAPLQATWLGYCATTGLDAIDYIIGDPWTMPNAEVANFTEKVWRLPEIYLCFTPPDMDVDVGPLPARESGAITFGSFNNLTKMNDDVVALWARVLQRVPLSRLFLKAKQLSETSACEEVISRFAAHHIGRERLILEGRSPTRAELLARYNRVDIALDPFPYTGVTTSIEALWMGTPVLTKAGDRFLSHNGETIAQNSGLADWIAGDEDDYVAKAAAHAANWDRLAALRLGLRARVLASPLFDAKRFARNFEAALQGMWNSRRA